MDFNSIKLKLLVMGPILIVLGSAIYFAKGLEDALILSVIGIVLLIGGIVYPDRGTKQKQVTQ